eukprot:TRINITY_DN4717_c0_g1_i8.p1 TRINITY_DN4717_c0_g1~~TRINITY_DN4717_c0_g1_i8.p1  ORF type:complete len:268 (-),score=-24.43 TRINITY_DN4717_c0_g1_i8:152-955(-)
MQNKPVVIFHKTQINQVQQCDNFCVLIARIIQKRYIYTLTHTHTTHSKYIVQIESRAILKISRLGIRDGGKYFESRTPEIEKKIKIKSPIERAHGLAIKFKSDGEYSLYSNPDPSTNGKLKPNRASKPPTYACFTRLNRQTSISILFPRSAALPPPARASHLPDFKLRMFVPPIQISRTFNSSSRVQTHCHKAPNASMTIALRPQAFSASFPQPRLILADMLIAGLASQFKRKVFKRQGARNSFNVTTTNNNNKLKPCTRETPGIRR